jgi:hypothetical protein
MNLETLQQVWLVTMNMATEVRRKGIEVGNAFDYLRTAKVILNERTFGETEDRGFLFRASELIDNAQRDIFIAAEALGKEFTVDWENKIREVLNGKKVGEFPATRSSKFYSQLPRSKNWVRVPDKKEVKEKVEELKDIEVRPHGEGYLLLIGDKASLRKALDAISPVMRVKER